LVLAAALLISAASFAQKGSVGKANSYLIKEDFANAKAEIDVAITIEKNATKSKTWFTRGKIYQGILSSEDEAVKALDAEALPKSVEAYGKVMSMESETNPNYFIASQNMETIWGNYVNKGAELYGQENFEGSMMAFEEALIVKPQDSVTLYFAGISAQQGKKVDKCLMFFYKMVDLKFAGPDVFSTIIYLERTSTKDDEKALEVVRVAKEAFPEESKFGEEEISLLLTLDKVDEAKAKLEASIEADPSNTNNHLNLGVLYDNLASAKSKEGKSEEAKAAYKQAQASYMNAIKVDPENYIGNFNTGVIYVNMAKEYFDQARDMDLKTYQKKGEALEEKGRVILKDALPYLEKADAVHPNDISVLSALQQVYTALKMFDKAEVTMDKVEALETGN